MSDYPKPQALVLWLDPSVEGVHGCHRRAGCGIVQEWATTQQEDEGLLRQGACKEGTSDTSVHHNCMSIQEILYCTSLEVPCHTVQAMPS